MSHVLSELSLDEKDQTARGKPNASNLLLPKKTLRQERVASAVSIKSRSNGAGQDDDFKSEIESLNLENEDH